MYDRRCIYMDMRKYNIHNKRIVLTALTRTECVVAETVNKYSDIYIHNVDAYVDDS